MLLHMLLAGFGGQGILFDGKVAAQVGMLKEKQVSWLPSYGPEMPLFTFKFFGKFCAALRLLPHF